MRFVWLVSYRKLLVLTFCCGSALAAFSQVNVLTYHNDLARTGQNTNETILTPQNVNTNTFGQLFAYPVDGYVYAQPLYVFGLNMAGQGVRNVVFAATEHNSVYAFDADTNAGPGGGLLWHVNLGTSALTPNNDFGNRYGPYQDVGPEVGITGTPVIDLASGTLYVDAFTHDGPGRYLHRIHALSVADGTERPFGPVVVAAAVAGIGADSINGIVTFNPRQQIQRPALTLAGGVLYVGYAGYADTDPYHGWIIGFSATNLEPLADYVFNTTPNASMTAFGSSAGEGGIWMSGNGLSVDAATNLYFAVGNGSFDATNALGKDYGDSFILLSTTGRLAVADFFTPYNEAALSAQDLDLGSGGVLLVPDSAGTPLHPHLLVGSDKSGTIYLLDRDHLGHFNAAGDTQVVQELPGVIGGTWSSAAWFNNSVYFQGAGDLLTAFPITAGLLDTNAPSQSTTRFGFPGATPSISADGTNHAIAWALQTDAAESGGAAILHAYDAYDLSQELYNSGQAGPRDGLANAVKFTVPTVANGKVYVGAQYSLGVFGLGSFLAVPSVTPAGGLFTNSVTVTLTDDTPEVSLRYTLDNSEPSAASSSYAGPLTFTNTTVLKVAAFKPGSVTSRTVAQAFIDSASLSFSIGFAEWEFYPGALRSDLEDPAFSEPAAFTNFLAAFETPSGQGEDYAERVSGYFIPPQTTNYVFFVSGDDDTDLFLSTDSSPTNKHLIATETVWSNSREWVSSAGGSIVAAKRSDQFAGTWPGGSTIHLVAGTAYYLEAVHHQAAGADAFAATYIVAGTPDPSNGDAPNLAGQVIGTYGYNNAYLVVSAAPQDAVSVQGATATFHVTATGAYLGGPTGAPGPPLLYQWQCAPNASAVFTNITGANASDYTTPPLALADDGTRFRVVLTTVNAVTTNGNALLTVLRDATQPLPTQVVYVNPARTTLVIAFSKRLDSGSAQTPGSFRLSPGALVPTLAALDDSGTNVTLTMPAALPEGIPITLAITGLRDTTGNSVPADTSIDFSFAAPNPTDYQTEVMLDQPVAYWRFNEAGGAVAYDSASGLNNATYGGAAGWGVPGPRPPAYPGLELTNTAVRVQHDVDQSWVTAPALNLNTNTVTVTAWLYPIGGQADYTGLLMCRDGSDAAGFNYTSGEQLGYTWNSNDPATWGFNSGLVVPQNQWSFVALVIQPTQATLFVGSSNGLVAATNPIPHLAEAFGVSSWLGDDLDNAIGAFNGVLDEVAVFNQALEPARLAAHYQAALLGGVVVTNATDGSFRFWSIDLVSGQVVLQWTGAGTLEAAPAVTGPWTTLATQTSPFVGPVSGARFYRLRQ